MKHPKFNESLAANERFYKKLFSPDDATNTPQIEIICSGLRHVESHMRAMEAALGHKYSPSQPRVPAGSTGGGQWTDGSGSETTATTLSASPNMDKAVDYLEKDAEPKSIGKCATYVRRALNNGGFKVNPTKYAKDYGPYLEKAGFEPIVSSSRPSSYPALGYKPQKGDVSVVQSYPSGNPAGHMTMYSGTRWISDWPQRTFWANSHYRDYGPNYTIYRYPQQSTSY
jgi:hypothetical protein